MRAVVLRDGGMAVEERPDPSPGSDELLVKVESAGINGADMAQRAGNYPPPPGAPVDIPGLELAGTVVGIGASVRRFAVGDRVMSIVAGGAQAELCLVHERVAMAVPDGVSLFDAGGFPEVFVTAHDALFTQCELKMGERLLVTGGAGGVGTAAIQLGAVAGAEVVASVRNTDVHEAVASFGATVVNPDEASEHGPYDVILELVGAPNLGSDLESVATGGRIVVIGTGAGSRGDLELRHLMVRRAVLRASTLRARPLEEKAIATRLVERQVLPHLASGRLRVPVAASFPLEEAEEAYDRFTHPKVGKVLIGRRRIEGRRL
jgi:NADPH:quinone reductase